MKPRLALAGGEDEGGFCFSDTDEGRYTLIGLGKTGCAALSVLNAEGGLEIGAIKIAEDVQAISALDDQRVQSYDARDEKLSSRLSSELASSWVTIILMDLNDEIPLEVLETVVNCAHQEAELSIGIVIESFSENSFSSFASENLRKLDTCIHLSREALWDIGSKTQKMRLCTAKDFSLAHLSRCLSNILLGKGFWGIDYRDLKALLSGHSVTAGLSVEQGEGRVERAILQAANSPGNHACLNANILACLTCPTLLMEEFTEIESSLEALGAKSYLVDAYSGEGGGENLLLTLFIAKGGIGPGKS